MSKTKEKAIRILEDPQGFWEQNKRLIVLGIGILAILFIYSQKDTEEDEETKEDKKFLRQMILIKEMNGKGKSKVSKSSEDEE
ncbi:MAG: hypothetical protein mread185_000213 [Mycoplasmataceae bacterium]|nr:MAG: hypothetical protein mread185_000213 [Mycoplasmataceae bacterium]